MSSDPRVEQCLRAIREQAGALADEVRRLSPEAWDGQTNCSPWRVRDLVGHVVASGEGFKMAVERALVGITDPPQTADERERRQEHLAESSPTEAAQALDAVVAAFEAVYTDLDDAGLDAVGYHRRGNRSVRWFAAHRLAEVSFHRWDFGQSFGRSPAYDERIAALLLPTLLESNAPRTYAAGLTPERGNGERYLLAVEGDPSARWLVTIEPERLTAEPGGGEADVTIGGSAASLALLVYGRHELRDMAASGALKVEGDPAVMARFPSIYPRP